MNKHRRHLTFTLFIIPILVASLFAVQRDSPKRWENAISAFEAADQQQSPSKGGILFIGSSSIRGWDLNRYFPELPVINRGFGGSQIADSTYYAERIIFPYQPRIIVLYAGDNDIAAGKTASQVFADYKEFVRKVRTRLPETRIIFISIKPSIKRWSLVKEMRRANQLIRDFADSQPRLEYVDVDTPMIGPDGKPRPELFQPDGLHLNAEGYRLWSDLVRKHF